MSGRKNWVAPSSLSCARPFCSCLSLSGSRRRARRKSSGAKFGMPVNDSASPSLKLSPMEMVPWLWMPITSPGYAVSTISRSLAMKVSALASFSSLPVRACSAFMPAVNLTEQRRMLDEEIQEQLYAEVVDGRAEEHRCLRAGQVGGGIEGMRGALHQFEFVA